MAELILDSADLKDLEGSNEMPCGKKRKRKKMAKHKRKKRMRRDRHKKK